MITPTTILLLLYVLPLIIVGVIHYLDPEVKTLGNFLTGFWCIFSPGVNILYAILLLIQELEGRINIGFYDFIERIKNIKIK